MKTVEKNTIKFVKTYCLLFTATSLTFLMGGQRVGGVWQWRDDSSKTVFSDADLTSTANGDCIVLQGPTSTINAADCSNAWKYVCMKGTLVQP